MALAQTSRSRTCCSYRLPAYYTPHLNTCPSLYVLRTRYLKTRMCHMLSLPLIHILPNLEQQHIVRGLRVHVVPLVSTILCTLRIERNWRGRSLIRERPVVETMLIAFGDAQTVANAKWISTHRPKGPPHVDKGVAAGRHAFGFLLAVMVGQQVIGKVASSIDVWAPRGTFPGHQELRGSIAHNVVVELDFGGVETVRRGERVRKDARCKLEEA